MLWWRLLRDAPVGQGFFGRKTQVGKCVYKIVKCQGIFIRVFMRKLAPKIPRSLCLGPYLNTRCSFVIVATMKYSYAYIMAEASSENPKELVFRSIPQHRVHICNRHNNKELNMRRRELVED